MGKKNGENTNNVSEAVEASTENTNNVSEVKIMAEEYIEVVVKKRMAFIKAGTKVVTYLEPSATPVKIPKEFYDKWATKPEYLERFVSKTV